MRPSIVMLLCGCFTALAHASNGYMTEGYGIHAKGMGGASVANAQDVVGIAANPATLFSLGNRIDMGAEISVTRFKGTLQGSASDGIFSPADTQIAFAPEFGVSYRISPNLAVGVAGYVIGGNDTRYANAIPLFGSTNSESRFEQYGFSPSIVYRATESQYIGLSLLLAHQRLAVSGQQSLDNGTLSDSPGNVTNRGWDTSSGVGFRLGWAGEIAPKLKAGASFQPKTKMSAFEKYKGVIPEGRIDIPAQYAVGLSWEATSSLLVLADVVKIRYSGVNALGNSIDKLNANRFGNADGPGFGWQDQTVYKLGLAYRQNDWTWRVGFNHAKMPVRGHETLLNMTAISTVEDHVHVGFSYALSANSELSTSYIRGMRKSLNGEASIPASFGGGEASISSHQHSLGVAYGYKFR